ncbi:MAG: hypothetical protein WCI74_12910 [Actinomycetes bacterium]
MIHLVGALGGIAIMGAYILATTRRISVMSNACQGINLVGAVILMGYSLVLLAWVSVALNTIWGAVAVGALVRNRRTARRLVL